MEMNLPKRDEIKRINEMRRLNPRSESPMEYELYEELLKIGLRFHKQFPIGFFFADLALPEIRLVVEYDGHDFHDKIKDDKRDDFMRKQGWAILRVSNLGHLFRLTANGEERCCAPLKMIAEEIEELCERRRYKFGIELKRQFSDDKKMEHIMPYLKNAYEKLQN